MTKRPRFFLVTAWIGVIAIIATLLVLIRRNDERSAQDFADLLARPTQAPANQDPAQGSSSLC